MKISVISSVDKKGGAANIAWSIKKELEKTGDQFDYFVGDKITEDPRVRVIKRNFLIKIISKLFPTESLYDSNWILKDKNFQKSDLVHCHNIHGSFFSLRTLKKISENKPVVWTLHDEWSITPHCAFTFEGKDVVNGFYTCPNKNIYPRILWNNRYFLEWEKRQTYKHSKLNIVVPCLWLKNRVEKSILKDQKIHLIYYGIDTNIFTLKDRSVCREELGLPLNKKIIFFVADGGKNNLFKGWQYTEEIIGRFKNNPDVLFVCAGNDTLKERDGLNNIIFIPQIKQETLSKYYSASDILLYSSVADNFPLIILEAMSCGLPIVSFDTGGIKEATIHKENGYIARYKDVEDLYSGIKYIFDLTKNELDLMSQKSSSRIAEKFNLSIMVQEYKKLYNKIINQ